ncbi:uncharacterized protein TRIVIDRAFT_68240 [Trichoderma virens Gv29-8]|uniref:NACHT-NTPase and P-loop NTPases N-terminal domain-containing protein n=1 Tax=Hypocrea virens (strain Gv29-8 / FGSC 10586) TaxID=413071 RepID=G9N073_HYPVG|nr:uncharacterized protein TRIVIDRAFT_68240 [Trichoderma virens Gv29-8]EHK19755.1 hypothetical protein TRIVIDRAFT_68240 [Trichoderma virens Gv29-8]UKZ53148.1 hypothetical protein TrVGV298_006940 [Trichoderma virens]
MSRVLVSKIITSIGEAISKFMSIGDVHGDINTVEGLPPAFKDVNKHIPTVCEALTAAQGHIRDRKEDRISTEMTSTVEECKIKATRLAALFLNVVPQETDDRVKFYHIAVRQLGERSRVETLMKDAMEAIKVLLTVDDEMKEATKSQLKKLVEALQEVSAIPQSLQDESSSQGSGINNYGSGPQNVNTGSAPQYNNNGNAPQINGGSFNGVNPFSQK